MGTACVHDVGAGARLASSRGVTYSASVRLSAPDGLPPIAVTLGRYEVILPIASGGMATVCLAKSRGTGGFERYVAIKLTHPHLEGTQSGLMADLLEEAKLAVRIRHPNIVQTLDVGENGESLFLVMDYVEGDSLSGLIRRAQRAGQELPLGMKLRVLCDALAGLHAAHDLKDEEGRALDVVHRDVSPQNILVGTDGMARLADFGIARAASRLSQTEPGSVKGKVAYMPPEQIQGGPLDRRCDVWAAGVIAWELVANRRLFEQHDQLAVAMQLLSDPIPGIHAVNPDVPHALAVAIGQALEKDRAARTPTAAAFRSALLEACLEFEFSVWVHVAVLKLDRSHVLPQCVAMALNSPLCYAQSQKLTHGTGNRDLGLTRMVLITLSLPPLEEQKRIVARVEALVKLCDVLEQRLRQAEDRASRLVEAAVQELVA